MIPSYNVRSFSPRALLLEHLELTNSHVETGEQDIAKQKQLISRLRDNGRPTATANGVLGVLETLQAMHVAHRDRLEERLATANPE